MCSFAMENVPSLHLAVALSGAPAGRATIWADDFEDEPLGAGAVRCAGADAVRGAGAGAVGAGTADGALRGADAGADGAGDGGLEAANHVFRPP